MATYILEGWFYEGNHANGKDSVKHSDMEQLAKDLGISLEDLHYDVRGVLSKAGESTTINGKVVTLQTLKVGKNDGFGRNRLEIYSVL